MSERPGIVEKVGYAAVDVACGTGATLAVVRRAFPEAALTGVDISERMLERARTRVPGAAYVHADVATFAGAAVGDPGARFDLVTSVGGLEFTADLPIVLARLGRLVRPGGHLIATYEPVITGWPPQDARVETNLASNGGPLTTVRWEPGEIGSVFAGDPGWTEVRSALVAAYLRDGVPVVYGWLHVRRPD